MAFQGASSSSSSTRRWTHEVFLSFRGEDTRLNFTSHLYAALCQKGIKTFKDDDDLRSGEEISQALLKAIEESRISIVVFSQSYASSRWCLDELLKIVGTKGQIVLLVFYEVDPSDVRHQNNSYEKALAKHEKRFKDDMKVQSWKAALTQVANLSGWHSKNYRNEAEFIDVIVQNVSRIVNHTYLHVAKHPVGLESRVQKINSLLRIDKMNDIRMVGILGVGGIGKTTIAKEIYNSIHSQFDGCCFLESVREASTKHFGIVKLQRTLLSAILGHTVKVDSVSQGISVINQRLCSKKVLLILDDVDNTEQLDKLAGGADWFGSGSRIIITTRDRKVLIDHEVDDDLIYRVKKLDREEALELFCWNAFKGAKPIDDFLKLMRGAMNHVGGLPLALEVLGSYLYRKDLHVWESALNKCKSIPHEDILERLKISYDGLGENEQNIFLDIACFFIGKPEDDIKVLESADYFPVVGIDVLKDRCLININFNYGRKILAMHNLLRDMGREVVRQESRVHPGKRSRLWCLGDVRQVFEDDTGTDTIQGILIDLPKGETMWLSSEAFKNMKSLRLLIVNGAVGFDQEPIFLPNDLRVLDWPNFPVESLPPNFCGEKLIVLRMPRSQLRRFEGVQKFQNMKIINFSGCEFLKIIPDVSKIPNVQKLTLNHCTNLVEIHDSVGSLDKLVSLSLRKCHNLSSFLTSLKLRSLKYLNLDDCSRINHFPEIEWEMKSLKSINFGGTGIKELPSSIRYLIGLEDLHLAGCRKLTNLPSSIYQLQHLERLVLGGCSKLVKFPEKMGDRGQSMLPPMNSSVSNDGCSSIAFPALQWLDLENCVLLESDFFRIFNCSSTLKVLSLSGTGIVTIPACIKRFVALKELYLDNCKQLQEILAFPQNADNLKATGCMSLDLNNKCWLPELPGPGPMCIDINMEKFQSMKIMNFSKCQFLKIIPDVAMIPNLEELTFDDCTNLVEIHDSVGSLDKLVSLSLRKCDNLSSFLTNLKLRSLKFLDLNGCSRINLFPEIEWEMKSLKSINFGGTGIKELPSSIQYLIGLEVLHLAGCRKLTNLPSSIYQLQRLEELVLSSCSKLVKFPEKMGDSGQSMLPPTILSFFNDGFSSIAFPALRELDLEHCVLFESDFFRIFNCSFTLEKLNLSGTGIVSIPACIKRFVALKELYLDNCKQLREILAFPQNAANLKATGCMSLDLNNKCWLPELPGPGPMCIDINMEKFQTMRILDFSRCEFLKIISDVSKFPNLDTLTLDDCTNLIEIHDSVGSLDKLNTLSLKNCYNLTNLPSSIYQLQRLKILTLGGCSKLVKFPEKMGDDGQSMLPPTNSSVSNDDCSSKVFPELQMLDLRNCVLLESDFFRIFNCSSTLQKLDLSGSGIVTIPACIKRFVALEILSLDNCKQLREILAFPPNSCRVCAMECMSLDLYNKCWLPAPGPVGSGIELEEHLESRSFDIEVTGNNIPDWFSYRKEVSNSNSCEIDIDVPADLDGEITTIAFSAVLEIEEFDFSSIWVYVISGGVEIYHGCLPFDSDCVSLHFHVPESLKRKEYNGHLRVKFVCYRGYGHLLVRMKSCGVHLVRRCEEKMIDSIDGIQVTKRPRDDDGNLESNWYPQQKRHSSSLGVRISSLIQVHERYCARRTLN